MQDVKTYTQEDILKLTRKRSGEEKLGEFVQTLTKNWKESLRNSSVKFVIFGIAEDIGVRANYGRAGANTAFKPALESFLSQQHNQFLNGETILVLGEVNVVDVVEKAATLETKSKEDIFKLRELVSIIDKRVEKVIKEIIACEKIPIVIGGGHNNSYGCIKGASLALNKKINVLNCDPHLDFRPLEGRHSGNGFSYAYEEGSINRYSVFGLHEQYNNQQALDKFKNNPTDLFYNSYESVFVREEQSFSNSLQQCIGFVKNEVCGLELDLDAITNVPSSAKTSSGISPVQARQFIHQATSKLNPIYLHIAEGAPVLSHIKADNKTGKLIAYLISDFIKARVEFYRDI